MSTYHPCPTHLLGNPRWYECSAVIARQRLDNIVPADRKARRQQWVRDLGGMWLRRAPDRFRWVRIDNPRWGLMMKLHNAVCIAFAPPPGWKARRL